jgi:hypothetical protein
MHVRSGDRDQRFVEWVRSLAHDPSQAGSITILAGINQNRLVDSYAYLPAPPSCPRLFRDRAILTVRNDTVAETNDHILNRLTGTATDFYSVDTAEANY